MNFSKIYDEKSQEEVSFLKDQHQSKTQALLNQIEESILNERREVEENKKLQKRLQIMLNENKVLREDIEENKNSILGKNHINIIEEEEQNDIRNDIRILKESLMMKEEVSLKYKF